MTDKKTEPKKNKTEAESWDLTHFKVESQEGKTRFHDFSLPKELMRGIQAVSYTHLTLPTNREV